MVPAASDLELHRVALTGHCYRMMGSAADADDAVQETLVRAFKSLGRFDGRASLKTWLHKIATNVCFTMLEERQRRARPIESGLEGTPDDVLEQKPRTHWLEPVPEARVLPHDADPSELLVLRQSIRLAFVAALQNLPPKQRAALLFADVLGWSAEEIAGALETTVPAVNSALQRARATLSEKPPPAGADALTAKQKELVDGYLDAFLRYDVDALVKLLHQDAVLSMPPFTLWLRGEANIRRWLLGPGAPCRGSKLQAVQASGLPAFAQWRKNPDKPGYHAWALIVLELDGAAISSITSFLDVGTLFPKFGLPLSLP